MRDVRDVRADFPILARTVRDRPLIYLDNAATSQKPRVVIEALTRYYEHFNANIHRGVHTLSQEATEAYEGVRSKVAALIGASDPACIIYTRNTTESINLVAATWGRANIGPGDEILLTEMEHHSNLVPWQLLAQEKGARLRHIPIDETGRLRLETLDELLTERTKIVSVVHMSNVLGTINPVAEIARRAHAVGAVVLVDGAQSVPHLPVNVQELGCDFLAFSSHKMLGPTGVGVLWGRRELLEAMPPYMGGGDMIRQVWLDHATWNDLPWKFEAGTPNIADVIAFGTAIDYLRELGMDWVRAHELALTRYALEVLGTIADVTIYGPTEPEARGGVVSFNLAGVHPHDVGQVLDEHGIAIRAGHHCCQPLMRRLGVPATARASFSVYNVPEEVDALAIALAHAKELFISVPRG